MTAARTDWAGWTNQQLDTLVAVTQAERLAVAEREVTHRRQVMAAAHRAYFDAHDAWATAVQATVALKGCQG